jgi:hypothetical protein
MHPKERYPGRIWVVVPTRPRIALHIQTIRPTSNVLYHTNCNEIIDIDNTDNSRKCVEIAKRYLVPYAGYFYYCLWLGRLPLFVAACGLSCNPSNPFVPPVCDRPTISSNEWKLGQGNLDMPFSIVELLVLDSNKLMDRQSFSVNPSSKTAIFVE